MFAHLQIGGIELYLEGRGDEGRPPRSPAQSGVWLLVWNEVLTMLGDGASRLLSRTRGEDKVLQTPAPTPESAASHGTQLFLPTPTSP